MLSAYCALLGIAVLADDERGVGESSGLHLALLELPTGLYSSLERSPGFAPGLYPAVGAWRRSRGIVGWSTLLPWRRRGITA